MSLLDLSWLVWVDSDLAWFLAGISALAGFTISIYNMVKHIYHYTTPDQQLHIIRILFIVPLYSVISWLSIKFHEEAAYLELFRDIYESFVIYCFLTLILGYVGGEANCISLISLKPPLTHPIPCCFLPKMKLNVRFLRFCKQSCMQFIIVKPIMAIITVIMLITDNYTNVEYEIFMGIVYNISYSLALYGLICFYLATREDIRAFSPVRKFFAVKAVIFATYWQSLFIQYFPGIPNKDADRLNDFILCCEMSLFALLHLHSFPWWEFRTGVPPSSELILSNVRNVLSFKDVVRDVYHNIMPAYQTYVLQSNADGTIKTYKTKTYMVGNLHNPSKSSKYRPNFAAIKLKYGGQRKKMKFIKFGKKSPKYTDELDLSSNDDENGHGLEGNIMRGDGQLLQIEQTPEINNHNHKNNNSNNELLNGLDSMNEDLDEDEMEDSFSELHTPQMLAVNNAMGITFSPDSQTGLLISNNGNVNGNNSKENLIYKKRVLQTIKFANINDDNDDESDTNSVDEYTDDELSSIGIELGANKKMNNGGNITEEEQDAYNISLDIRDDTTATDEG